MANARKGKKPASSSRSKTSKRKSSRKSRVRLNTKSMIIFACAVILVCGISLVAVSRCNSSENHDEESYSAWEMSVNGESQTPSRVQGTENGEKTGTGQKIPVRKPEQKVSEPPKEQGTTAGENKPQIQNGDQQKSQAPQRPDSVTETVKAPADAHKAPEKNSASTSDVSSRTESQKDSQNQKKTEGESLASINPVKPGDQGTVKPPKADYDFPKARNRAKIMFVIDDAGMVPSNVQKYVELPFPLTVAVLPQLANSRKCADVARSHGKEVILHQPMMPKSGMNPGPGKITGDMSIREIQQLVSKNIEEIGPVKGINNHEGSLITADPLKIGAVLDVCDSRGLYFIDSRTTSDTKAREQALERDFYIHAKYEKDIPSSEGGHPKFFDRNAEFLDDPTVSRDYILSQIRKGLDVANKKGWAIMIGHVDKDVNILPALLKDIYPELVAAGYVITTPGQF